LIVDAFLYSLVFCSRNGYIWKVETRKTLYIRPWLQLIESVILFGLCQSITNIVIKYLTVSGACCTSGTSGVFCTRWGALCECNSAPAVSQRYPIRHLLIAARPVRAIFTRDPDWWLHLCHWRCESRRTRLRID